MANREHNFFYAPTWDYPPNGPIKLGNVIPSVKKPHRPLSCVSPEDSALLKTEKKTVQYTKEKLRSGRFSILTKFLSIFGFGVDVGAEIDNNDEEMFTFDTVETTEFVPTADYVESAVESANVRRFLQTSRYRKPVYIITGVKIVTGAKANTTKSRGPGIEGKVGKKVGTSWEGSSDFVFAYRVSKVFVSEDADKSPTEEEYRKGAMLGDERKEVKLPGLAVLKIEEPAAEAEGFDAEKLLEDDAVVFCAIPREEESDE
ncbi:hypothetical protein CPLU01_02576 [Colletotrichum plurivorum]|uniref:Uncharacterized protein n=1 Tax=Colletotrichum plurivorum TaxID=2175906 RepID=A0A8H6KVR9_9PEZI|nr:hypothetical protein CPLU01_02576 [Colletotrichum plurivorum]